MLNRDILVVGAGASGMTAATAACKAGCRSVLVTDLREYEGGVLPQCIHSGFGDGLTGPEYVASLRTSFLETKAELLTGTAVVAVHEDRTAVLSGRFGLETVKFKGLILASGCREVPFGALMIGGPRPAGIYTAGQIQEMVNIHHTDPGDNVVIIGSGDLGMIIARRFILCGKKVIGIIEKEDHYGAMARNYHECAEAYGIPIKYSTAVTEVTGNEHISGVYLSNGEYLPCQTLVVAAGMVPDRDLIKSIGNPEWLMCAGNCSRVHSLVTSAAAEAEDTGKQMAEKIYERWI